MVAQLIRKGPEISIKPSFYQEPRLAWTSRTLNLVMMFSMLLKSKLMLKYANQGVTNGDELMNKFIPD